MVTRHEPARAGDAGVAGSMARVLSDVAQARAVQDAADGVPAWPDGTGGAPALLRAAVDATVNRRRAVEQHQLTWRHLLVEQLADAFTQTEPEALRAALVQVIATFVSWIQAIDRRGGFVPQSMRYGGGERLRLIRDGVPPMASAGPESVRAATDAEFDRLLRAKLHEEVGEYLAANDPVELGDILEVLYALGDRHELSPEQLEALRAAKRSRCGGYTQRLVVQRNDPHLAELPPPPIVRQTARALLLTADDRLVLFRRTVPNREQYWITPGGEIEPGDPDPQVALRRELLEELGATVGQLRQVLSVADFGPQGRRLHTFYLCRVVTMDPSARTAEELADPSMGHYDVELVPCDPIALGGLHIRPTELAEYLSQHAAQLPDLMGG